MATAIIPDDARLDWGRLTDEISAATAGKRVRTSMLAADDDRRVIEVVVVAVPEDDERWDWEDDGTLSDADLSAIVAAHDGAPRQQPLNAPGAIATLLAVVGAVSVQDAANAVHLTVGALTDEAVAWGVASS